MKLLKRITLFLLIILLVFITNLLITTGYFRTIENKFKGEVLKKVTLSGAEDITISHIDSFALVSATDRKSIPRTKNEDGGLYYLDLKNTAYLPLHLTSDFDKPFAPHGISMLKTDSTYTVMAVNHTLTGHTIEVLI